MGVCRTSDALALAQNLAWVRAGNEGLAELTVAGRKVVSMSTHEDRLLQAILDYIDIFRPSWIQNAAFGRHKVLSYASTGTRQVFFEADLATGTDNRIVKFWDMLAARARGQKEDRLVSIGRRGEYLTVELEKERTRAKPKWISLDSNLEGYDILSIVGPNEEAQVLIEVKATTMGLKGLFHITRTEWERATASVHHLFHLWLLKGESDTESVLAVVEPDEMRQHVPLNFGEGQWTNFEVPFEAFKDSFDSPEA
jgi:hypothetical protein